MLNESGILSYFPIIIFLDTYIIVSAMNGGCNAHISYNMHPSDQISDLNPYLSDFKISGEQ